jgi:citrate synthase
VDEWVTAPEALRRLGVRPQTLYAYVSRGLVAREPAPGRRTARYRTEDVDRLAAKGRGGSRGPARIDVPIESALTLVEPGGRLAYRGWDVLEAAASSSFEEVATWLWTGVLGARPRWNPDPVALRVARRVQRALPPGTAPADRLRVAAAAITAAAPLAHGDRAAAAVVAAAGPFVATLVEALPLLGAEPPDGGAAPLAAALWPRLTARRATPEQVALLDDCLVLLADHELASSTVAARVAASTWAAPGHVVLAGMATMAGPLHGGTAEQVRLALRHGLAPDARVPGFGHKVYVVTDPRYTAIRRSLEAMRGTAGVLAGIDRLGETIDRHPNVDLALGAFAEHAELVPDAVEALYGVARTAGWIAHGLEEYRYRLRFRGRATYVGPPLASS